MSVVLISRRDRVEESIEEVPIRKLLGIILVAGYKGTAYSHFLKKSVPKSAFLEKARQKVLFGKSTPKNSIFDRKKIEVVDPILDTRTLL